MPTVVLLTTEALTHPDLDSPLLVDALTSRGASVELRNWYDPDLTDLPVDLLVLRTPWDYFDRLDEFLTTIGQVHRAGGQSAVGGAMELPQGLSRRARRSRHSGGADRTADARCRRHVPDLGDVDQVIVKPAVSGAAIGVGLFERDSPDAAEHLATLLIDQDVLVQPFIESVRYGERSLIFFGGTYSHAIRKMPADGDFRVQVNHGGSNTRHIATSIEIAAAERALAAVPGVDGLAYARVDLVGSVHEPLVMELELIEPELFLPMAPGLGRPARRCIAGPNPVGDLTGGSTQRDRHQLRLVPVTGSGHGSEHGHKNHLETPGETGNTNTHE